MRGEREEAAASLVTQSTIIMTGVFLFFLEISLCSPVVWWLASLVSTALGRGQGGAGAVMTMGGTGAMGTGTVADSDSACLRKASSAAQQITQTLRKGFQSVLIADINPAARNFSSLFISLARSHHWKSILSNGDLISYTADLSFHHSWEVFLWPEVHLLVTLALRYL